MEFLMFFLIRSKLYFYRTDLKNKMHKLKIVLPVLICLSSCFNLGHKKNLIDGYSLYSIDIDKNMVLWVQIPEVGDVGVIRQTVFAIGYDSSYIIAKQHPQENNSINKKITNYYIIPLKQTIRSSKDDNYWGPLSKEDFNKLREKLNIDKKLQFSIIFKDLE